MQQINLFKTRSFWATAAAMATGVEQAGGGSYDGLISAAGTILQSTGVIPDAGDFSASVGPVVTAGLGLWAYVERLRGRKQVVVGKAKK